jgi:hypothetical protein
MKYQSQYGKKPTALFHNIGQNLIKKKRYHSWLLNNCDSSRVTLFLASALYLGSTAFSQVLLTFLQFDEYFWQHKPRT